MVTAFQLPKFFGLAVNRMGYSMQQLVALIFAMLLLFVFDVLKNHYYLSEKKAHTILSDTATGVQKVHNVFELVLSQGLWFRWLIYIGLLFMILVYGAYGLDYTQTEFIYFQF